MTTCAKCEEMTEEIGGECWSCLCIKSRLILIDLDVDAAIAQVPGTSRDACLIGLHKARYERKDIAPELRHASGDWLRSREYSRIGGLPLLPLGELPE